jgi:hypothetical protein
MITIIVTKQLEVRNFLSNCCLVTILYTFSHTGKEVKWSLKALTHIPNSTRAPSNKPPDINLRLVSKQLAEEVAAVFFKHNTFVINHLDDLPASLTAQYSLRRIEMRYPILEHASSITQYLANSKNMRFIHIKAQGSILDINAAHSAWLAASLRVLNYEDGGLKFMSGCFFDSFRVHGKRGGVEGEVAKKFIEQCQVECSRIARLGLCRYPLEEFVFEGVRVGIEFTLGGITTVRIL